MHLRTKVCTQRQPFFIDVDPSATIQQVKDQITQHTNVPSHDQFLSFDGRTLEDEHILTSHDIKDGSTLWLVIFPHVTREKYSVSVSIVTSETERQVIDIDIYYYDTVAQVKQAIFERTSIPTSKQRIIFAGKQIEDDRIFSNYGIQKGSTVHLVLRR